MDFPTTLQAIINMRMKHPVNAVFIEDKANGSAIISMLRKQMDSIIDINPEGGKVARVNAIAPLYESGNVYIPEKEWTNDYVNELVGFPNSKNDDEVDATSQALNRLRNIDGSLNKMSERDRRMEHSYNQTVKAIAGGTPSMDFLKF